MPTEQGASTTGQYCHQVIAPALPWESKQQANLTANNPSDIHETETSTVTKGTRQLGAQTTRTV
jgi:hypothetical protein